MTVDIYGHLIPSSNRGAVNQLDATQPSTPYPQPCQNKKAATLTITAYYLWMVPKAGLEPARVSPLPPQDSVSTCSTTSAHIDILLVLLLTRCFCRLLRAVRLSCIFRRLSRRNYRLFHRWPCIYYDRIRGPVTCPISQSE
jgi:hypothetical protein